MEKYLDIRKISELLPHRYPFLLVDRIVEVTENSITGLKNVTRNENFFNGHFPEFPVMPGVLQIEALAQTAGVFALMKEENRGKIGFFASIENARFKRMVFPGDRLDLHIDIIKFGKRLVHCQGTATVEGEVATTAEMKFMTVSKDEIK